MTATEQQTTETALIAHRDRLKEELAVLDERLSAGMNRIHAAEAEGKDTTAWVEHWHNLLHSHESKSRELYQVEHRLPKAQQVTLNMMHATEIFQ